MRTKSTNQIFYIYHNSVRSTEIDHGFKGEKHGELITRQHDVFTDINLIETFQLVTNGSCTKLFVKLTFINSFIK